MIYNGYDAEICLFNEPPLRTNSPLLRAARRSVLRAKSVAFCKLIYTPNQTVDACFGLVAPYSGETKSRLYTRNLRP
jgi:hypothetical protein